MGKKGRKTRWRTLAIPDGEYSDSEESNTTTSGRRAPKEFPQKSYYSRFTYSSQSTPTRRYQYDGTKSTRSSSTASENKITFNEDEYTRITTPRQDVLFKKGYLSKPKTYQTQTSTGNSTSTSNSTGNGTPDHQLTDLEYESQFVFPNGFVDQNGIYYINSFEPYPVMVYNPPTYYPDYTTIKSKRYSTGSLTESTSPNNEEVGQDLSQSETPSNVSDFAPVYNVIYPAGFYYNSACQPEEVTTGECAPKRLKKRRRKRLSRSKQVPDGTTSEYTDESSEDEVSSDQQESTTKTSEILLNEKPTISETEPIENISPPNDFQEVSNSTNESNIQEELGEEEKHTTISRDNENPEIIPNEEVSTETTSPDISTKVKYDLKPDAEEFVPRAYRGPEIIPMETNMHFVKIPSNFVPLPILSPMGDFNGQGFNAFIPSGIPINFIPQNFVNFIPNVSNKIVNDHTESVIEDRTSEPVKETVEVPKSQIDIGKIVSKLEEAAKKQEETPLLQDEKSKNTTKGIERKNNFNRRNFRRGRNLNPLKNNEATQNVQKTTENQESKRLNNKNEKESIQLLQKPAFRNYSDTLKKPQIALTFAKSLKDVDQSQLEKLSAQKEVKEVKALKSYKTQQENNRSVDEWVSVTNRKKRKNKNLEEFEDIKIQSIEEKIKEVPDFCNVIENIEVENKIALTPETEIAISSSLEAVTATSAEDTVVATTLTNTETDIVETKIASELEIKSLIEKEPAAKTITIPVLTEDNKIVKVKNSTKTKSKKSIKPPIKKVIIKDIDLSIINLPEEKVQEDAIAPVDVSVNFKLKEKAEEVIKLEEVIPSQIETLQTLNLIDKEETSIEVVKKNDEVFEGKVVDCGSTEKIKETPEKRVKKKKKKSVKPNVTNENNLSANCNTVDDSYDFLLETSILDESGDRTNIELSQELDKMIQRGMYNNLEEKIKSLNISTNDSFFETIINNISSREPSMEKNGYNKNPDFSKIINNTSYLLKSNLGVTNSDNTKLANFFDKPPSQELMREDRTIEKNMPNETENLYPITKAVREWMTKTRETTPDVELLKSPSTIYREFGMDERKNGDKLFLSSELRNEDMEIDDEITIYSLRREDNSDLLECKEDELSLEVSKKTSLVSLVEEGEDVVEMYDSKYGKNEDFLQIQREVEEKKLTGNFPKHGDLPYRAICCSIM